MFGFFKYLVLLPNPHRRKLFVASRIPERLRSRGSLTESKLIVRYMLFGFGFSVVSLTLVWSWKYLVGPILASPWLSIIVMFGIILPIVIIAWRYFLGVWGANRSEMLRYAFYAERPEFSDPKKRRSILALDQWVSPRKSGLKSTPGATFLTALTLGCWSQKNRSSSERFFRLVPMMLTPLFVLGVLVALLVFIAMIGAGGYYAYILLALATVPLAVLIYLILWARKLIRDYEAVPANSPLRAIVSEAYELYPEYDLRK